MTRRSVKIEGKAQREWSPGCVDEPLAQEEGRVERDEKVPWLWPIDPIDRSAKGESRADFTWALQRFCYPNTLASTEADCTVNWERREGTLNFRNAARGVQPQAI